MYVRKGHNDMNNTKIEWCDSTWNPVTGCYNGCGYCYAKGIARRFGLHGTERDIEKRALDIPAAKAGKKSPYPFDFEPTLHRYRLDEPQKLKKPRTIFVCSMADLFGKWVSDEWIEEVLAACEKAPQHRYLFLTKNPQRYAELHKKNKLPLLKNMWYGASVTNYLQAEQTNRALGNCQEANLFLSVEPLLEDITKYDSWVHLCFDNITGWVILGAETGNRKGKAVPKNEWIDNIIDDCEYNDIPLFMKDSLIPIVGKDNMSRDFPWKTGQEAKQE